MKCTIAFVVFPEFQLLDAAGPMAVFEQAERLTPGHYRVRVRAVSRGPIVSSCGVPLLASPLGGLNRHDTALVVGGMGTERAMACRAIHRALGRWSRAGVRLGSVCTGTFVLAAAGLLEGRTVTTHWAHADAFRRTFPLVNLKEDHIFVRDGDTWSSAGVTAGIDLALALVTHDLGDDVARRVAEQLVVYYQRPGGQSQHSSLLATARFGGRFEPLIASIRTQLQTDLPVEKLAALAGMSPRNFSRAFTAETGVSPGRAVERLRAECARAQLRSSRDSVQEVAQRCGFGSAERMRRTLLRLYGVGAATLRAT